MGITFQREILGGQNENPLILVLDSVGCQYRCWFCYARDILDAVNPVSPHSGWKVYKFMSPQDITVCTECKLTSKYRDMKSKRPFARFRITGGEPLFATNRTLVESEGRQSLEGALNFWLETFKKLNSLVRKLKEARKLEILTHNEFVKRGRKVNEDISTWLTEIPGNMEIRFDTNGHLFSCNALYAQNFVMKIFELHRRGDLDSIRVNIDYSLKGPTPIEFEWSQSRSLPVDATKLKEPFEINDHPQFAGIKNLNYWLKNVYEKDETFDQSLRFDIERGINFTDTTKYGTRKLGILYDSNALDWNVFAKKANIAFSEVNNPIQLSGQAKRSKYIEDHLRMGAEVEVIDTNTGHHILKFDPFPDDLRVWEEYRRSIKEHLERANKIISDGVARAKKTGRFGVQVIIRPVKKRLLGSQPQQKRLDSF
jgi:organic radical activating enzyme